MIKLQAELWILCQCAKSSDSQWWRRELLNVIML